MATPNIYDRQSRTVKPNTRSPQGETTLTLQRLPSREKYPLTPSWHAGTAVTPSSNRPASSRHTPRGRGAAVPTTPFGLRAMQKRAANTPKQRRRRSSRMQRETTFEVLRNLGRALAPLSKPTEPSPTEKSPAEAAVRKEEEEPKDDGENDILDSEPEMERPRLSLPLSGDGYDDDEDGSPDVSPPRLSLAFTEDDITRGSVEYPRRDISDRDRTRLSMMSDHGARPSENFGDLGRLGSESDHGNDTGMALAEDGYGEVTDISQGGFDRGGDTEDLGRFNIDFNFPSPNARDVEGSELMHDDEGFELSQMALEQGAHSDASPMAGGDDYGFGSDHSLPPRASLSESPGAVGGGLREEEAATVSKKKKISRYGIPVPDLPSGVVRKLAIRFARTRAGSKPKISKATMAAIQQASSWFFEQVSEDLEAYSKHAGRKTIDESDVATLMRRQRQINSSTTVFSLAQKHLPQELLQEMRLAMPP